MTGKTQLGLHKKCATDLIYFLKPTWHEELAERSIEVGFVFFFLILQCLLQRSEDIKEALILA